MKLETPLEIFDLANDYQLKIIDNQYQGKIYGINEIHKVSIGDITFVDTPKYFDKALNSEASVIIINQKICVIKTIMFIIW
jgi:UDP-3-O-[3-hydroxymyristoyl] glucosamine N-acyltransferase